MGAAQPSGSTESVRFRPTTISFAIWQQTHEVLAGPIAETLLRRIPRWPRDNGVVSDLTDNFPPEPNAAALGLFEPSVYWKEAGHCLRSR